LEYEVKELLDLFKKEEINTLKARISGLEEENRKLLLQIEKKDEKTKKIIAAKQDVDRELKEAGQKLSSLENELLKLNKESSCELRFRFSESLSGHRLDDVLFLLGSVQSKTPALATIYLAKDETLKNLPHDMASRIDGASIALIKKIESSTGKAVFYDVNQVVKLVLIPVFPISSSESALGRKFDLGPLKNSLEYDKILVLNAHAGETFIGVAEAGTFVKHDIIRTSVMGKHTKGGWSQKRFQSLVEEDVRHHAEKVMAALSPMIEKDIQYVVAGGEGKLIKMILEGYDYPLIIKSMDTVAKGNAEQVLREAMAVRVYGI